MQSPDIEQLEEEIYRESRNDGAGESLLGVLCILFGINWSMAKSSDQMWIYLILLPLIAIAWRKRITYPRLGHYKISAKRRSIRRRAAVILIIMGIAGGVFVFWVLNNHILGMTVAFEKQHRFLSGGLFSVAIPIMGIILKLPSHYLIAVANIIFLVAAYMLDFPGGCALMMTGILSLGIGISKLMQFLKAHPVIKQAS